MFTLIQRKEGLLCSKGKIGNSSLPYNSKCPILLNRKHYLTKLIVLSCYNRVKHNGQCRTLAEVRSLYWITKGKSYVKINCIIVPCVEGLMVDLMLILYLQIY